MFGRVAAVTSPKVAAIVQARMGSSRLPGKVLLDIGGQPMLGRVISRLQKSKNVQQAIVATTDNPADQPIVDFCTQAKVECWRGSEFDVLDRFYSAARFYQAEVIVRITADCPLIDPDLVDQAVEAFFEWGKSQIQWEYSAGLAPETSGHWDFVANRLPPPSPRSYPIGLDCEVCSFTALQFAWREAVQPSQREHVMPFLYDPQRSIRFSSLDSLPSTQNVPQGYFRVLQLDHTPSFGHYRWTVDAPEDLELVRQIFAGVHQEDNFNWMDVIHLLEQKPELNQINAAVVHKTALDVDSRHPHQ